MAHRRKPATPCAAPTSSTASPWRSRPPCSASPTAPPAAGNSRRKPRGTTGTKAQSAQLLAGGGLEDVARQVLAGLVTQFQATMEAVQVDADIKPAVKVQLLASLADAYNKSISASKRVLPETSSLATAMEVIQRLAAFIREQFPQHVQAFAEILEPFGEVIAKGLK